MQQTSLGDMSPVGDLARKTYSQLMGEYPVHLVLKIETKEPIEVGDFVGEFTALTSQYRKFMRGRVDVAPEATMYVTQVKEGSIVAELIPDWLTNLGLLGAMAASVNGMSAVLTLEDFAARHLGNRIRKYLSKGGRDDSATKGDLADFHKTVAAIANDPNGTVSLDVAYFEDGKRQLKSGFKFTTAQARKVQKEIENHRAEIEGTGALDRKRVLMTFVRTDIRTRDPGKVSGELVVIEEISEKPRALIYASDMAESRIKAEVRDDDSVFKKGFVVDVNIETKKGKPVAYRVTHVHQVIDLPDDDDEP